MINVYCRDYGWLFEDLKRDIAAVADDVVASETPLPDADAWIAIRTTEACTPVAGWFPEQWAPRTVVQVHDFRTRSPLIRYGAVSLVHPKQRETCPAADKVHVQPIGARRLFTLRESMPKRFTVGWVGRDVVHEGRHIKRPQLFVDAVLEARRQGCEVRAALYGAGLDRYAGQLGSGSLAPGVDCRQMYEYMASPGITQSVIRVDRAESLRDFYHSIDALIVTCEPEPGPLSVYEALACGVPVIGTETGAIEESGPDGTHMVREGNRLSGRIADLIEIYGEDGGAGDFKIRDKIRASVTHFQDDWCKAQVELARSLCA